MESARRAGWNPSQDGMESTVGGMESMHSVALNGIKTEGEGNTRQAVMPYAQRGNSIQFALRIDAIPSPSVLDKKELNQKFDLALFW